MRAYQGKRQHSNGEQDNFFHRLTLMVLWVRDDNTIDAPWSHVVKINDKISDHVFNRNGACPAADGARNPGEFGDHLERERLRYFASAPNVDVYIMLDSGAPPVFWF